MTFPFRLPLPFLCLASLSPAQTPAAPPAAPPAHSHAPGAGSHNHGVVTLDQFVTSASPVPRNQVDLAQSTTVLDGRALLLKQQSTLGETLAAETGIHSTAFGPGASRPVIRGLGGDRLRLLENGVATLDASVTSPDHAVAVEPFLVDRIEVLRGPASLLYGANAVGGVVNVLTHRIETDLPAAPFRGSFDLRGTTGSGEISRGGVLDFAVRPAADRAVVFHLDGSRRSADNLRIPGFAESDRVRAEEIEHAAEEGEPAPDFARGRLPNSSLESRSAAAGVSYVSPHLHFGVSYSGFSSDYGVPGHAHELPAGVAALSEGVRLDLRQRRTDAQAEWHGDAGLLHGIRLKFGHARYRHDEIETDGAIGTSFATRGYDGRLEFLHGDGKPWSGAVGLQAMRSDFSAAGPEAFLPDARTSTQALFAFEEVALAPVTWQFGARYERTKLDATGHRSRSDGDLSASVGAVWKLDAAHVLAFSVNHTGRPANHQERYARGPHAGTASYEIGDPALGRERSLGLEASLRRRTGFVTGALTVFTHRFQGFLFARPTGELAREHDGAWEIHAAHDEDDHGEHAEDDDRDHGHAEELPVYRYVARDARFHGVELETLWHLHAGTGSQLDLRLAADLVRAREGGRHLPRIPAARFTAGLAWADEHWSLGAEVQRTLGQTRTAPGETATPGYTNISAHMSRRFERGDLVFDVFVRGTNLADEEIRPHPSFVKDLAPLAGRAATAGVRFSF
jgi:iron complex outermembrane receptor protein